MQRFDLLIVGAGPVGLALALALKDSGYSVALADARDRRAVRSDPRVLALSHGSRQTLARLGVWANLRPTAIHTIHISQQGGLGRTLIDHRDYDQAALGYVVSAGELAAALGDAVEASGVPLLDNCKVGELAADSENVSASLIGERSPPLSARLVACAEGGMQDDDPQIVRHDYDQHALITQASVAGGHRHIAYERFTPGGPLALLPNGDGFAIVHTVSPEQADRLIEMPDAHYLGTLQATIGTRVQLTGVATRLRYPLGLRYRKHAAGERTVWLGNAAQTLHPVAGQGFNLALRDVWALARHLREADGIDPGSPHLLRAYATGRGLDRQGTIRFTDGLVRLFSNDSGVLRHLRGAGLLGLDTLPPLRHFVAKRMMFGARAWP
ncbi:MAG: FAD-dependent monooxygenase [Rhodocyclaceae bacterium]|nr:FAD-dependent monooxygenase [Rhodocyclaceae bacterium]